MGLMDQPVEILMEIFKRLPVKSVYRLRSVSKTLLELVDSPPFVSLHSLTQIATNAVAEEPQLILRLVLRSYRCYTGKEITFRSLNYDAGKGKVTGTEIMSMKKKHFNLHFVFHNLFCLEVTVGEDKRCFLIDPFREEVLRLPTSDLLGEDTNKQDQYYGMGFDYRTSTYKIVRLIQVTSKRREWEGPRLVAQVHVIGTSSWHEIPAPAFGPCMSHSYHMKSLCAYGDMHWMFRDIPKALNHIISFDFTKEEFYKTPHPASLWRERSVRYITLDGYMAIVKIPMTAAIEIWVMKDYNTKKWTLEYNIDLQTLGHDLQQGMLRRAACDEWENGIVFTTEESDTALFLDLRSVPVNHVTCQIEGTKKWESSGKILCFKRSLISLKEIGNLVEEPGSHNSLLDFSRKYLGE